MLPPSQRMRKMKIASATPSGRWWTTGLIAVVHIRGDQPAAADLPKREREFPLIPWCLTVAVRADYVADRIRGREGKCTQSQHSSRLPSIDIGQSGVSARRLLSGLKNESIVSEEGDQRGNVVRSPRPLVIA